MNYEAAANMGIAKPSGKKVLHKKEYKTGDIISLVQDVVKAHAHETKKFASLFEPTKQGLRAIFDFVDRNFSYVEDPAGNQWVQTPAHLWSSKQGDCKSYTVFISSILQNIGVPHFIRYVAYHTKEYRHVYPVAILNGVEVPMDVVWKKQEGGKFGQEKPYTRKKDFKMAGLYKLASTQNIDEAAIIGQLQQTLADIEQQTASIPNLIDSGPGDVTQMSEGELERFLMADRYRIVSKIETDPKKSAQYADAARAIEKGDIAGLGSTSELSKQVELILAKTATKTKPAFSPFTVEIPNPVPPHLRGFFKNIGKFIKKVGKAVSNAFKSFVNWIFKGVGKSMGPFFIYRLLKNRHRVKSGKIKARLAEQDKAYNFIKKLGKFDDSKLQALMLNGVLEKTGQTPEQIAASAGVPQIGALPLAAIAGVVVKAIQFVIQVIQKIARLFKGNSQEAGRVDQSTMSDPSLFEEEARLQAAATSPSGQGGGGVSPLAIAAGLIPATIFLLR